MSSYFLCCIRRMLHWCGQKKRNFIGCNILDKVDSAKITAYGKAIEFESEGYLTS